MEYLSKRNRLFLILALFFSINNFAQANFSPPVPGGIVFGNPADIAFTRQYEFMFSDVFFFKSHSTYDGTVNAGVGLNFTGTSRAKGNFEKSAFRLAMRVNPKVVIGLDYTQPIQAVAHWTPGSNVTREINYIKLDTKSFSPRISYMVAPYLFLGAGLEIVRYSEEFNLILPVVNNFTHNISRDWKTGFSIGAIIMPSMTDIIGISYYSSKKYHLKGDSYASNSGVLLGLAAPLSPPSVTEYRAEGLIPALIRLDYTHIFSPKFKIYNVFFYVFNSSLKTLSRNFQGLDVQTPFYLRDSVGLTVTNIYTMNQNLDLFFGGGFNSNPGRPEYNVTGFSLTRLYNFGGGMIINIQDRAKLTFGYIGIFSPHETIRNSLGDRATARLNFINAIVVQLNVSI